MAATEERTIGLLSPRERVVALQPLFASDDADVSVIRDFAVVGVERRFAPGEWLLDGSTPTSDVFFITEGSVATQYKETGISQLIDSPGVVGSLSKFCRVPLQLSAQAQDDVIALAVPHARISQVVLRYGATGMVIVSRMAEQVMELLAHMPLDPYDMEDRSLSPADPERSWTEIDALIALRSCGFFEPRSTDALGSLLRHGEFRTVPAGSRIHPEGVEDGHIYFVLDGGLRASTTRRVPDVLVPRQHFAGLFAVAEKSPVFRYELRAEVDSVLLVLDRFGARSVLEDHTRFLLDLMGLFSRIMLELPANRAEGLRFVKERNREFETQPSAE